MNKCPICGGDGTEVRRELVMHEDKLANEITLYCEHGSLGIITFYRHESLVVYTFEDERRRHGGVRRKKPTSVKTTSELFKQAYLNDKRMRTRQKKIAPFES